MFLDTQLGGISAMEPSQPRLTSVRGMARMAGIPSAVCMPGDPTIQLPPDEELIGRIALEDKDAFSLFYDRHSSRLLTLVCAILHDPAESEDVLQEAFLLIWTKAHAYDPRIAKPFTWAVTLTRNKAIDRLRSRQRRETLLTSADATGGLQTLEVPASTVRSHLSSGDGEAISTALGQLPPDQRAVIELSFFGGLSQSEIASRLNEPLGTVKARARRGMQKLRDSLAETVQHG